MPLSIDPARPGRTFSFESDPVRLDPIMGCILSSARVLVERFTEVLYSIAMAWLRAFNELFHSAIATVATFATLRCFAAFKVKIGSKQRIR